MNLKPVRRKIAEHVSEMRAVSAFTMIEIAISLAVIAFALVAIIGVLPTGLTVQKDNREETIINQDGPYWLEAIRNGAKGLDYLTNFVETITVTNTPLNQKTVYTNDPGNFSAPLDGSLTNGQYIIGLLTLPKFHFDTNINRVVTNSIVAKVRALTGAATEQGTANKDFAFSYYMTAEVTAYRGSQVSTNETNFLYLNDSSTQTDAETSRRKANWVQVRNREDNTSEIRLTFRWPLPTGPNHSSLRGIVSGTRTNVNGFSFFQPEVYTAIQP